MRKNLLESQIVLQTLKDKELYVKFSKSQFCIEFVTFLGHIVSADRIWVNTQKIEATLFTQNHTSPNDIRSFSGLAGYYRRFVEGFSSISSPLTNFIQKIVKFKQFKRCRKNFHELNKWLTTALVLTLLDGTQGFVLNFDA